MYKQILLPVTGTASDAAVFATALMAGKPFGAHLEFVHSKIDVAQVVGGMASGGIMEGGANVVQDVVDRMDEDGKAQEAKAWQNFARFCDEAGIAAGGGAPGGGLSADMYVETGDDAQILAARGRFADLIVAGRTRGDAVLALDVLEAALIDSGRPLLIAAAEVPADLLACVVIAWKDAPAAARAVASAMPLIEQAAKVVILSLSSAEKRDESAEQQRQALLWHNPNVSVKHIDHDDKLAVETLLSSAKAEGASLLVMGGYGHSRLREELFGGFTQTVLSGAELPVLIAH